MRSFTRGFIWLPAGVILGKEKRRHHQQDKDRQDWRKEENLCEDQMELSLFPCIAKNMLSMDK